MIRAFVSSTYRDLKDHRAYVIDRLLRGGIFVDPMEKWTAADDEPKALSQERVRDCQLCILLVGFRRGHVPEAEVRSVTQLEYAEALRRGIEVLVFMANEQADWPVESIAALGGDPEIVRWRAELKEHKTVGFFTPRPESIDVDAAVNRWLQERLPAQGEGKPDDLDAAIHTVEIRAHSNSDGVLLVWRTERPIPNCLGFALYGERLGDAGITRYVMKNRLVLERSMKVGSGFLDSTKNPIQNFRWLARVPGEARYRVAPVLGAPGNLAEPSEQQAGSAWTGWVSPLAGGNPGCRAFFSAPLWSATRLRQGRADVDEHVLRGSRGRASELRSNLGSGLRRRILELLTAAKAADRHVYAVLSGLDDPDLARALAALGQNARVVLPAAAFGGRVTKPLKDASVRVYACEKAAATARSNFLVSCDRWGTPLSVLTGSAAWTIDALCLRSNNAVFMESVPLARAYLDRWEDLACPAGVRGLRRERITRSPVHIREAEMALTLWNTPTRGNGDLRDAKRLIRGARQGVLFAVNRARVAPEMMEEILSRLADKDLFIEGLSWSEGRSGYEYRVNDDRRVITLAGSKPGITSTIVLVDPFGPHPVVMTGSHDLGAATSSRRYADLLIIENVPGLAAEYAVHLVGMFDHLRFRTWQATARRTRALVLLKPTPAWQDRYFKSAKRSEFNFFFGSLSPRL
ncbi:MAG: DUF4062 domain-containing protein [Deltaproteobacteria bacterium]|nr:DUF4062 domain-containing protein [Deltaproteobacteria bacterium]